MYNIQEEKIMERTNTTNKKEYDILFRGVRVGTEPTLEKAEAKVAQLKKNYPGFPDYAFIIAECETEYEWVVTDIYGNEIYHIAKTYEEAYNYVHDYDGGHDDWFDTYGCIYKRRRA